MNETETSKLKSSLKGLENVFCTGVFLLADWRNWKFFLVGYGIEINLSADYGRRVKPAVERGFGRELNGMAE